MALTPQELEQSGVRLFQVGNRTYYSEPGVAGRLGSGVGEIQNAAQISSLGLSPTVVDPNNWDVDYLRKTYGINANSSKSNFADVGEFQNYLTQNYINQPAPYNTNNVTTNVQAAPLPPTDFQKQFAAAKAAGTSPEAFRSQYAAQQQAAAPQNYATPTTPQGVALAAASPSSSAAIPFRTGLSAAQQQSIQTLALKPTSSWTETDKKNWNYATNNAPLPGTSPDQRGGGETIDDFINRLSGGATGGSAIQTSDQLRAEQRRAAIEAIKKELSPNAAPAAPSLGEERIRLRREQGIVNDEADLSDIRNDYNTAMEELRVFKSTAGQRVTEAGRLGAISEAERNLSFRVEGLAIRERAVLDRINTKNSYINQAIQDKLADYQIASQNWDREYQLNSKAVELYNTQLDDIQKDALATVTTMHNLLKDSGLTYDQFPADVQQQFESSALRAGLPRDTFRLVYSNLGQNEKVISTFQQKDDAGNLSIYSVTQGPQGIRLQKVDTLPASAVADEQNLDTWFKQMSLGIQMTQLTGDPAWLGGLGGPKLPSVYGEPEGGSGGTPGVYGPSASAQGSPDFRTLRHNNPIAFSIGINEQGNQFTAALDRAGIQWGYGDPFPPEEDPRTGKMIPPSRVTVKLADPTTGWEAARVVLRDSNAIQGWYANHTGRAVLSQYGVRNNVDFKNKPLDVQDTIIGGIFAKENGTSPLLAGPTSPAGKVLASRDMSRTADTGRKVALYDPSLNTPSSQSGNVTTFSSQPAERGISYGQIQNKDQRDAVDAAVKEANTLILKGTVTKEEAAKKLQQQFKGLKPSSIQTMLYDAPSATANPKVKALLAGLDTAEKELKNYFKKYTNVVGKYPDAAGSVRGWLADISMGTGLGLRVPYLGDIKLRPPLADTNPEVRQLFNDTDHIASLMGQTISQVSPQLSTGVRTPGYYRDLEASNVPSMYDDWSTALVKFRDLLSRIKRQREAITGSGYGGPDYVAPPTE